MIELFVQNNNNYKYEDNIKASLLALVKVLKTFVYYSDSVSFITDRNSPTKFKNYSE
jgi:hypothetical protein